MTLYVTKETEDHTRSQCCETNCPGDTIREGREREDKIFFCQKVIFGQKLQLACNGRNNILQLVFIIQELHLLSKFDRFIALLGTHETLDCDGCGVFCRLMGCSRVQ
jgi:hypothetical protein